MSPVFPHLTVYSPGETQAHGHQDVWVRVFIGNSFHKRKKLKTCRMSFSIKMDKDIAVNSYDGIKINEPNKSNTDRKVHSVSSPR